VKTDHDCVGQLPPDRDEVAGGEPSGQMFHCCLANHGGIGQPLELLRSIFDLNVVVKILKSPTYMVSLLFWHNFLNYLQCVRLAF